MYFQCAFCLSARLFPRCAKWATCNKFICELTRVKWDGMDGNNACAISTVVRSSNVLFDVSVCMDFENVCTGLRFIIDFLVERLF